MPQFGGKNAKKTKKTSSYSKRHFTVVMGGKEHGLYVSSTPSSAARKAVTKLCSANKSKKVEFEIREITQGSKKKTYGPYSGYIEKLKEPIELKGRVIKYKPIAKLSKKKSEMKGGLSSRESLNNSYEKIFENFKVENQDNPTPYHFKKRTFKSDTLYFGNKTLLNISGEKYYKFSLININDEKELIPLALRIIITDEEAIIFENKHKFFPIQGLVSFNRLNILPIPGVVGYKFFVIYTEDLLRYLRKMGLSTDYPDYRLFLEKYSPIKKMEGYVNRFTIFEKTLMILLGELIEDIEQIDFTNPEIFNWVSYKESYLNGFNSIKNFKDVILNWKSKINGCSGVILEIEQKIQKNKNNTYRANQNNNF
jgi:hypothetical protein